MLNTSRTDTDVVISVEDAPLPTSVVFLLLVVAPAAFWSLVAFLASGLIGLSLAVFIVSTILLSGIVGLFPARPAPRG